MDFNSVVDNTKAFFSDVSEKIKRSNFKTDLSRRMRYYKLLRDYINAPGSTTAEAFFTWYPEQLDLRMEKSPYLVRAFYRITKSKNEQAFRAFLDEGATRHSGGEGLESILKDWVPDEENRVISASASSDITDALDAVIDMCEDKENNKKQVMDAIASNAILIFIALILHYIIFTALFVGFVSPEIVNSPEPFSEMSMIQQRYIQYHWLSQPINLGMIGLFLFGIYQGLSLSVKHWHKRAVWLREEFFDFIPPWSLSKINQQYQILMVINNYFESGSSFQEALIQAKHGASPYVQYQIDKILSNSSMQANEAINIQFFGEMGNIVRERGSHVPLQQAIKSLVPTLRQIKKDKFDKTVKISTMLTIKPLIYGSFFYAIIPVIYYFIDLFAGLENQI